MSKTTEIPKIIWIFWNQGLSEAPALVQRCIQSWRVQNPGWDVRILDDETIGRYVDLDAIILHRKDLTIQVIANHIRIQLLCEHGGVWADATTFCFKPLDRWLISSADNGFFVFPDGPQFHEWRFGNWFIAAAKAHPTMIGFRDLYFGVFRNSRRSPVRPPEARRALHPRMILTTPRAALERLIVLRYQSEDHGMFWASRLARNWLRVYPYFVYHYLFACYLRDNDLHSTLAARHREQMNLVKAHTLQHLASNGRLTDEQKRQRARAFMSKTKQPVFKLNWRNAPDVPPLGLLWGALAKKRNTQQQEPAG